MRSVKTNFVAPHFGENIRYVCTRCQYRFCVKKSFFLIPVYCPKCKHIAIKDPCVVY